MWCTVSSYRNICTTDLESGNTRNFTSVSDVSKAKEGNIEVRMNIFNTILMNIIEHGKFNYCHFYSGYGHLAPKTTWGKVATIFYAILGIPLMLLCLSNIGDVMATSFRFLYWKVCCYVCEKKPKKSKRKRGGTMRLPEYVQSRFVMIIDYRVSQIMQG